LPLEKSIAVSSPAEGDALLFAIKILSTPLFRGEVKSHVLKFFMLKLSAEYDTDISSAKFKDIFRQHPTSLPDVSAANREHWWMSQE
jgi:hypothetical protein